MINSSLAQLSSNGTIAYLDITSDWIIKFGIHPSSIVGIIFNAFCLIFLLDKKLANKVYNFLWCRCFCNLAVCVFGVLFIKPLCTTCLTDHVELKNVFVLELGMKCSFLASSVSDILLILNRCVFLFSNNNRKLSELSKTVSFVLMLFFLYAFERKISKLNIF